MTTTTLGHKLEGMTLEPRPSRTIHPAIMYHPHTGPTPTTIDGWHGYGHITLGAIRIDTAGQVIWHPLATVHESVFTTHADEYLQPFIDALPGIIRTHTLQQIDSHTSLALWWTE